MIYGYCRISRRTQNIERQIRNIQKAYPSARIYQEAYTGTKKVGRKEFEKISKLVKTGDTIVFDSVSRMSRNAEEGIEQYFEWYNQGINLVFLKERHIDTDSYKEALEKAGINIESDGSAEGELISDIAKAITKFMKAKASADIVKAFEQAQKEVDDLHERTHEGIETARLAGKQIGQLKGAKLKIKKKEPIKQEILKKSKDFGGTYTDKDLIKVLGIARNTYYKYKKELIEEQQ